MVKSIADLEAEEKERIRKQRAAESRALCASSSTDTVSVAGPRTSLRVRRRRRRCSLPPRSSNGCSGRRRSRSAPRRGRRRAKARVDKLEREAAQEAEAVKAAFRGAEEDRARGQPQGAGAYCGRCRGL